MKESRKTPVSSLKAVYTEGESETFLQQKHVEQDDPGTLMECPPFPRYMNIELTNICNHKCWFCSHQYMRRKKTQIDPNFFFRIVKEAFELGAREIGVFSGAESLACRRLEEYVAYCRDIGFEYIYITTNGSLATPARFKDLIDAGISSIKFSINGGTRESYAKSAGVDDFDKVIENIRFCAEYRKSLAVPPKLFISFVETPDNKDSFANLVEMFDGEVDEILKYDLWNSNGYFATLPRPDFKRCFAPFNRISISVEGYLRGCCGGDNENDLVVEDLNKMSLKDAWVSEGFRRYRKRHLDNDLTGLLCQYCLHGGKGPIEPLSRGLSSRSTDAEGEMSRR